MISLVWLKIAAWVLPLALVGGLVWAAQHYYTRSLALDGEKTAALAQLAVVQAHAVAVDAAYAAYQVHSQAQLAASVTLRRKIDSAPVTQACVGSPAIGVVLDGLRARATRPADAGGAGRPAALPGGAGAAPGAVP